MKVIKEKLNMYICEHNCHNITVDVDKGVTPFMIRCEFTGRPDRPADPLKMKDGKCIGEAKSCCYPNELDDNTDYPIPTHEWFRPTLLEYSKLGEPEKDHVRGGGLLLRKRTKKTPIMHGDDQHYSVPNYETAMGERLK